MTPEDLKHYIEDIEQSRDDIRDDLVARFLIAAYPDELSQHN